MGLAPLETVPVYVFSWFVYQAMCAWERQRPNTMQGFPQQTAEEVFNRR